MLHQCFWDMFARRDGHTHCMQHTPRSLGIHRSNQAGSSTGDSAAADDKTDKIGFIFCSHVVCVFLWAADRECDVWVKEANSNYGKVMLQ